MAAAIIDGDGWAFDTLGLTFKSTMIYESWSALGLVLSRIEKGVRWALGDWFLYGQARPDWQEQLSQAIDATGYDIHTLEVCRWVSSRIDPSSRREDLSWSHHEAVARLDPAQQVSWLQAAYEGGWTVRELRERIRVEAPIPGQPAIAAIIGPTSSGAGSSQETPMDRAKNAYLKLSAKGRRDFRRWLDELDVPAENAS